jgi:hypothetical protein
MVSLSYVFARDFFGNLLDDCEGSAATKFFQRRRDGQVSDREAVLMSTLKCFENGTGMTIAVNIRVNFAPGEPCVWDQSDPDGRTVITLNVQDRNWSQYMYQFSHELCHVATNYRQRSPEFCWVDETICVLASWTVLRALSSRWKVDPPFPNWKGYSSEIRNYRQGRIDDSKRSSDPRPLKQWFQAQLFSLRTNPVQREKNAKIGLAIMPYFYEHASG